ncbi:hypothetical protein [Roseimaritima ulvae]|uniref:Glycoside hydrolase family 42 N-terminal domain-containing protein n=1 Tax=Roseimaritima ulvae TaxID=980254 RepID=A0A5B9QNL3_9BACT|nr:hypothetical protein [Roseimaritima ulvae]QEG40697.1 hypothetical protein UC8_27140 [Roseimaritima ulvae]
MAGILLAVQLVWACCLTRAHAAAPAAPSLGRPAQSPRVSHGQVVQRWDFDRHDDRDFDTWPDGWQRRSGRNYPEYVAIDIQSAETALETFAKAADAKLLPWWVQTRLKLAATPNWLPGLPTRWTRLVQATAGAMPGLPPAMGDLVSSQYLSVRLDGGGALLQSPKFPVSAMYSYVLSSRIQTHGLEHDSGWAEIVFLDAQGQPLKTTATEKLGGTTSWSLVHTPAIAPPPGCTEAVLRVRVEPTGPGADIRGEVQFDQLQLNQFPQLHVRGASATGIYARGDTVEISAEAMGLRFKTASIHFTLFDAHQQPIEDFISPVDTHQDDSQLLAYGGLANWKLADLPPGFYRMTAELIAADRSALQTETTFVVIEPLPGQAGPFGWTLPEGAPRGDLRALPEWLRNCHVGWLKYPCWIDAADLEAGDQLSWMVNRLMESGIQVVGLLNQPPSGTAPEIDARRPVQAVNVFRDQDVWQPLLETLMSRLTMKVQWWQLGNERDFSFLDRARLRETIESIQRGLQGYGQPLNMVLSWPWLEPQPAGSERVWKAVTRSEAETFTADELDAYLEIELDPQKSSGSTRTWLLLDPLPKSSYDTDTRIRDLVLRMATVRGHAVEAAFVSDPTNPETGLLQPDGLPDIMLLPWRTTAATLGTLQRIGSLRLPNGSSNIVLSDGHRSVMVLWNSQPTEEEIYLGENIEELSVWGVRTAAAKVDRQGVTRQVLEAGPVPKFILGLHPLMTQFRMEVELDRASIDSLLGRAQFVAVKMKNPQSNALEGDMLMSAGDAWELPRYPVPWQIRGSGTLDQPVPITLRSNAKTGVETIALQFRLSQAGPHPFLVYRQLRVGPEGLEVQITTRLDEQDNLVVRLEMENSSEQRQSYDCRLFPPGRQYQRQTVSVNAGQRVRREFSLPNGRSLLGQTLLLRAAEQDGRRVLNYTVQASP